MGQPNWERISDRAMRAREQERQQEAETQKEKWWSEFLTRMEGSRLGSKKRERWEIGHKFEDMVVDLLRKSQIFGLESEIYLAALCDDENLRVRDEKTGRDKKHGIDIVVWWRNSKEKIDSLLAIDLTCNGDEENITNKLRRNFGQTNFNFRVNCSPQGRGQNREAIPTVCGVDYNDALELMEKFYNLSSLNKTIEIENDPGLLALLLEILEEIQKQIEASIIVIDSSRHIEYQMVGKVMGELVLDLKRRRPSDAELRQATGRLGNGSVPFSLRNPRMTLAMT